MQLPIEVRLRRSRCYLGLLAFLLLACLSAIFLSKLDDAVFTMALFWTLCGSWDAYRRHYLLCANSSIIAIRFASSGWSLKTANNEWRQAVLLGAKSTITANLLCLKFKFIEPDQRLSRFFRPTACLFNDSANSEDLRRLRVVLLNSPLDSITSRSENSVLSYWR
ncbi:MAG: hypothetical protein AB8B48_17605 [Pseudomonadales bacterium]